MTTKERYGDGKSIHFRNEAIWRRKSQAIVFIRDRFHVRSVARGCRCFFGLYSNSKSELL